MNQSSIKNKYLRLTFEKDLESTLNTVLQFVSSAKKGKANWKFLIFSFHNLLQSAMVSYLSMHAREKIYTEERELVINCILSEMKTRELTKEEMKMLANPKVDEIKKLYKKCVTKDRRPPSEKSDLGRLNNIRNGFMHYDGVRWSISTEFLIELIRLNIPLLKHLAEKIISDSSRWEYEFKDDHNPYVEYFKKKRRYNAMLKKIDCLSRLLKR